MTQRRRLVVFVLAIAGLGLVVLLVTRAPLPSSDDDKKLDARLTELRTAAPEPTPPPGATLVSRKEYVGDLVSDGPAIEWTYSFTGTAVDFVAHYRSTLTAAGWTYSPPSGLAGQLALRSF